MYIWVLENKLSDVCCSVTKMAFASRWGRTKNLSPQKSNSVLGLITDYINIFQPIRCHGSYNGSRARLWHNFQIGPSKEYYTCIKDWSNLAQWFLKRSKCEKARLQTPSDEKSSLWLLWAKNQFTNIYDFI